MPASGTGAAAGGPSMQQFPEEQREPRVALGSLESSGHFQVCEGAGVLFVVPPGGNLGFVAVHVCFSSRRDAARPAVRGSPWPKPGSRRLLSAPCSWLLLVVVSLLAC